MYAAIYCTVFRFAIRTWNLMTPGREPDDVIDVSDPSAAISASDVVAGDPPLASGKKTVRT